LPVGITGEDWDWIIPVFDRAPRNIPGNPLVIKRDQTNFAFPMKKPDSKKIKALNFLHELCDFCGCCVAVCPVDCIELKEADLTVDDDACTLCGNCPKACPVGALVGEAA
jgi:ferredoxin